MKSPTRATPFQRSLIALAQHVRDLPSDADQNDFNPLPARLSSWTYLFEKRGYVALRSAPEHGVEFRLTLAGWRAAHAAGLPLTPAH